MAKVLVIRFSSIGDIVLTSPVIRCLKAQLKGVELHVLTKKNYMSIYSANPNIDQLHLLGKNANLTIKQLKAEKFDYIIDLHKNLRTNKIKLLLKQKSYTFPKLNVQKWVKVNFKLNYLSENHIVDRYFEAVKPLGVKNDNQGLDYFIPKEEEINLEKKFKTNKITAVAIGAKFATKSLPKEKFIEILSGISGTIVLLGGKEDFSLGAEIQNELADQKIINVCGELSLHKSASVVKQASVLLTHDTGMMHIASAFETPIVSIWGNTVPEFGMYPYRPQSKDSFTIHQVEGLSCRPCSKIGFQKCPKKHFNCMMKQDAKEIQDAILRNVKN